MANKLTRKCKMKKMIMTIIVTCIAAICNAQEVKNPKHEISPDEKLYQYNVSESNKVIEENNKEIKKLNSELVKINREINVMGTFKNPANENKIRDFNYNKRQIEKDIKKLENKNRNETKKILMLDISKQKKEIKKQKEDAKIASQKIQTE
ncbi:MAG: hypothetical protein ACYC2U_08785 [Candidatus Amoebophilus sp.]